MNQIHLQPRTQTSAIRRTLDALLDYSLAPGLVALSLTGVAAALHLGFSPGLVLFAQSVLNILAIALLELLRPERPEWALHSDRKLFSDLVHSVLGSVLAGAGGRALLTSVVAIVAASVPARMATVLWPLDWPIALQFLAFLLYLEFVSYWWHRILHSVAWLWPFHSIHHNPERMHVMKAGRVHWLTGTVGAMLKFALPVALGAPPAMFIAYAAATNIFGTATHANFRHRLPDWAHYIFNTAGVHHLHHSTRLDPGNSNFGNILSIWDVLFGSFRHPRTHRLDAVGVETPVVRADLVGELIGPLLPGGLLPRDREPARQ